MNKLISISLIVFMATGCDESYVPRPKGYFRIDLPEKSFHPIDKDCPFQFEIPDYSVFQMREGHRNDCWFNLNFPDNRAQIHFTYKPVENNLRQLLDESHHLSYEHHVKANDIVSEVIRNDSTCVYGLIYHLKGEVASPLQFYVTDSTRHFLRGSLYFNVVVNGDSLQPVVDFIERDIDHLVESMRWKPSTCP